MKGKTSRGLAHHPARAGEMQLGRRRSSGIVRARARWTGQNLNDAKPYFLLLTKIPKRGEDYPINPQKTALDLGKKEKEISSAMMTIACRFLVKSTVSRSGNQDWNYKTLQLLGA